MVAVVVSVLTSLGLFGMVGACIMALLNYLQRRDEREDDGRRHAAAMAATPSATVAAKPWPPTNRIWQIVRDDCGIVQIGDRDAARSLAILGQIALSKPGRPTDELTILAGEFAAMVFRDGDAMHPTRSADMRKVHHARFRGWESLTIDREGPQSDEFLQIRIRVRNGAGAERTLFCTAVIVHSNGMETARVALWSRPKPTDGS